MAGEVARPARLRLPATSDLSARRRAHPLGRARAMICVELRAADRTPRAGTSRQTHPASLAADGHPAALTSRRAHLRHPRWPRGGSVLVSRGGSIQASGEEDAPWKDLRAHRAPTWGVRSMSGCLLTFAIASVFTRL